MKHLIITLIALVIAAFTAQATSGPDTTHDGEPEEGDLREPAPRIRVRGAPAEMPAPSPLPHGITPEDPYANDPNADRACDDAAAALATWHQREGVAAYCKLRSYYARRGAKEPQRWVDGSYLHAIDVDAADAMWRRAKDAGWLDPGCRWHSRNYAVQLFTRGKWFDLSMYNARHLVTTRQLPCWDPAIMDRTDVGARVVVARAIKACYQHYRKSCSKSNLRRWWREWVP